MNRGSGLGFDFFPDPDSGDPKTPQTLQMRHFTDIEEDGCVLQALVVFTDIEDDVCVLQALVAFTDIEDDVCVLQALVAGAGKGHLGRVPPRLGG